MRWKRALFFLLINILVSAAATLLVLNIWDRYRTPQIDPAQVLGDYISLPTVQPLATATPRPTATRALQSYQVQPGETLGEIALAFDVSMEELLALNGRTDPNSIGAGEVLFVPVPGSVSPQAAPAAAPDEIDPLLAPEVEIVTVVGVGDLNSERVQLRGIGERSLTLTGWQLLDEDDNQYTFPTLILFGGGAVNVYSRAGVDTVIALYWGQSQAVWQTGETLRLVDAQGNLRASYMIP